MSSASGLENLSLASQYYSLVSLKFQWPPHLSSLQYLGKQFQYAEKRGIPFVVITGEEEMKNGMYQLKNLDSGEQVSVNLNQIIEKLR